LPIRAATVISSSRCNRQQQKEAVVAAAVIATGVLSNTQVAIRKKNVGPDGLWFVKIIYMLVSVHVCYTKISMSR
jgi:hypothetical protein